VPPETPAPTPPAEPKTFFGQHFSIDYPAGWNLETREQDRGSYLDTTIRNPADPLVYLRVDVTPKQPYLTPEEQAAPVVDALRPQTGYQSLGYELTQFAGYPALRWEYLVSEHGVPLRKVNIFFQDTAGNGFALLTEARASAFTPWLRQFAQVRDSFTDSSVPNPPPAPPAPPTIPATPPPEQLPPAPPPSTPPSGFCDTHPCIPGFDEGEGSVVQCADGMWSHSGGLPGACSYHGGELAGGSSGSVDPPSSAPSSTGNGYPVICGDGTLSNSGGIQGACSHHGGEAG
jgi:hypothetical protein